MSKTEIIRGYKTSLINSYQHIFITDYSLTIIDSRMPNRSVRNRYKLIKYFILYFFLKAIHSHHELLRPPTSFTQIKSNNQHFIFINDEFNTNILNIVQIYIVV